MGALCCCWRNSGIEKEIPDEAVSLKHGQEENIYIALRNYEPSTVEEIGLKPGDRINILEDVVPSKSWFRAINLNSAKVGIVPITYLAKDLDKELWWFPNETSATAESLLLWEGNPVGSFLVRPTKNLYLSPYALSVKTTDPNGNPVVKHYKINYEDGLYFISNQIKTNSLQYLVSAYLIPKSTKLGLCENLRQPCAKVNPQLYEPGAKLLHKVEIDRQEITLEATPFSNGNYSNVFLGKWQGQKVAVKVPNEKINQVDFIKEVKLMQSLRHKNIATLYGVCTANNLNYIVLEYMSQGSLLNYLRKNKMTAEQRVKIGANVASAMAFLESQKVVHRDLAARNVLLNEKLHAKLSDFGLSLFLSNEPVYSSTSNTAVAKRWMAPEFLKTAQYTIKSDVWSFGILLMEIYTDGKMPYSDIKPFDTAVLVNLLNNGYMLPQTPNIPDNIYQLMTTCWNLNPDKRLSFMEIETFLTNYELFEDNCIYD